LQFRNPKVYNPSDVYLSPVQRKKIPKFVFFFFGLAIFFAALVYLLFYSPFFQIKNIVVLGTASPPIVEDFNKLKGGNLLLFSSKRAEKIASSFAEVSAIRVSRGLPDTLKINLQTHEAKIVWQTNGTFFLVDNFGRVFQEVSGPGDLPKVLDNKNLKVKIGENVVSENFLNFIADLNNSFREKTGVKIIRFEVNETIFQVDALTEQGWRAIFDTTGKAAAQLDALQRFSGTHQNEAKEYIDLRVEGRVYFK